MLIHYGALIISFGMDSLKKNCLRALVGQSTGSGLFWGTPELGRSKRCFRVIGARRPYLMHVKSWAIKTNQRKCAQVDIWSAEKWRVDGRRHHHSSARIFRSLSAFESRSSDSCLYFSHSLRPRGSPMEPFGTRRSRPWMESKGIFNIPYGLIYRQIH